MGQIRRNLELKVACSQQATAHRRDLLAQAGIPIASHLYQRDVYFRVSGGRRKLRWIVDEREGNSQTSAELITYSRPDEGGSRWSEYSVDPIDLHEVDALETNLIATHGVLAVVVKQRDLALWGATRIHLDKVEDLGSFIELETVTGEQSEADAQQEHQAVIRALKLDELPIVAGSYSDLLLERFATREHSDANIVAFLKRDALDPKSDAR